MGVARCDPSRQRVSECLLADRCDDDSLAEQQALLDKLKALMAEKDKLAAV